MDDMILAGAFSIAVLYSALALILGAGLFLLAGMCQALIAGDSGRAAVFLSAIILITGAYAGTGFWIQRTGRI